MAKLLDEARSAIDNASIELNSLSQDIWNNPELNFEEHYSHELLSNWLVTKGFKVDKAYKDVKTAFRACYGEETASPHVAIFCEYDALPEIGHGCGHNLIAEVGVAAGLGVKAAMESAGKPIGRLTVLGSPAEEGGGGKVELINRGALDGVDAALMSHPSGSNIDQYKTLAIVQVDITFHGKASHASAFPWEGVNALDAAVLAYQNLSCLRQQLKPNYKLHGVIKNGGAKPNIIPEETTMEYYFRAPTAADLLELINKATACIEGAALATGCTVNIEYQNHPFLDMVHSQILTDLYSKHAASFGLEFADSNARSSGSTDMGNVSYVVPSIHPLFDIAHGVANHTREFTAASGSQSAQVRTIIEGKILAGVALDVMQNMDVPKAMKAEFQNNMAEKNLETVKQLLRKCSKDYKEIS